ncbi:MAG: transcriptional regulator [Planctomycetes bacterium]|nr:transcriptional regulator [Planctomycetota bacterium]
MSRSISGRDGGLDPLIHEAARLKIVAILNECEVADFNFLLGLAQLSRGNLSSHMAKLVEAGYVNERKGFVGKLPHTDYALSARGQTAFREYLAAFQRITQLAAGVQSPRVGVTQGDTPR